VGEKGWDMRNGGTKIRGADVLIARRRARVKQRELATRMGTREPMLVEIENERVELSQAEYQRMLAMIEEIKGGQGQDPQT